MGDRFVKALVSLVALVFVGGALGACGGVQVPPEQGQCHDWREWVPPTQNEDGSWNEGYCRDR